MQNHIFELIMKYSALEQFFSMLILHRLSIPSTLIWLKMLTLNDTVARRKHKQVLKEDP